MAVVAGVLLHHVQRHPAASQVHRVEAGALQLQRLALPTEEPDEGGPLVGPLRPFVARVGVGVDEHVRGPVDGWVAGCVRVGATSMSPILGQR